MDKQKCKFIIPLWTLSNNPNPNAPKIFFFNLEQAYSTAIKMGMGLKMSTQNFVVLMLFKVFWVLQ